MGGTCLHSSHGGITGCSPPLFTSWLHVCWHEWVFFFFFFERVYKILHCPFWRGNVNEVCVCGCLVSDCCHILQTYTEPRILWLVLTGNDLLLSFTIQIRRSANNLLITINRLISLRQHILELFYNTKFHFNMQVQYFVPDKTQSTLAWLSSQEWMEEFTL